MSPTKISIDLTESPLNVGGFLMGKYKVIGGSKGIKLAGEDASATKEEVVECLKDAAHVVKRSFGAGDFDAAILVVPNNRDDNDDIISYGRNAGFNITQVINEHTAVAAAYLEKVSPSTTTNLAIISLTGGFLEVSVVSIVPIEDLVEDRSRTHEFILLEHQAYGKAIDFDQADRGRHGLVGVAVKALVLDPFEKAFDILKHILGSLDLKKFTVDKVVFVGKASRSEKVREAVKERFGGAEVWEGVDNPEEIVAYGAAYLSFTDKEMKMYLPNKASVVLNKEPNFGNAHIHNPFMHGLSFQ